MSNNNTSFPEEQVECPNFVVCETKSYAQIMDCFQGFCPDCAVNYGIKLETRTTEDECSICYHTKTLFVKYWNCTHWVCKECFKRLTIGIDENAEDEPVQPSSGENWSDLDYQKDQQWIQYAEDLKKWQNSFKEPHPSCPLCRTETTPVWNTHQIMS